MLQAIWRSYQTLHHPSPPIYVLTSESSNTGTQGYLLHSEPPKFPSSDLRITSIDLVCICLEGIFFSKRFLFIIFNCVHICVSMYVYACKCRCPRRPEVYDALELDLDSCKPLEVLGNKSEEHYWSPPSNSLRKILWEVLSCWCINFRKN